MEDVAERYRRLAGAMTEKIQAVPADGWDRATPCEGWSVRELVRHVVDIHGQFQSMVGRSLVDHPRVQEEPLGAFVAVRDQMQADLGDPEKVAQEYDGALGRSTFGESVDGFVCFDLVVHGWDLARATSQDETLDPRDVRTISAMVEGMGETMRKYGVVGPPVEPPPGASEQQRLLGALGRRG
jgi:uncharacterized protein (TIGR03086 family)